MAQTVKNLPAVSVEGNGHPLQYSCLENPVDRGALWGYSPRGGKELDTTEQLTHNSLPLLVLS